MGTVVITVTVTSPDQPDSKFPAGSNGTCSCSFEANPKTWTAENESGGKGEEVDWVDVDGNINAPTNQTNTITFQLNDDDWDLRSIRLANSLSGLAPGNAGGNRIDPPGGRALGLQVSYPTDKMTLTQQSPSSGEVFYKLGVGAETGGIYWDDPKIRNNGSHWTSITSNQNAFGALEQDAINLGNDGRALGNDTKSVGDDLGNPSETRRNIAKTGSDLEKTGRDLEQTGHDAERAGHDAERTGERGAHEAESTVRNIF